MRWLSDRALERLRSVGSLPEMTGDRYRLVEPIGRGGMGTVYLARDTALDRLVAVKILDEADASGELAARLRREARVLAGLEHPGIVPVHDVGELADGRVFYTMKLVRGHRLDHYLDRAETLPERLRLFIRICEAVAFAHARGVLHRDLKPQNIMVGPFGEVLVMDWGLAKLLPQPGRDEEATLVAPRGGGGPDEAMLAGDPLAAPSTRHGVILGTPGYMAPEQARGEVGRLDGRADVYALGAVLRFLLTGRPPTDDTKTAQHKRSWRTRQPRRLAAIVTRAMAERPADRYLSAEGLAADVARFLDGRQVLAYPENPLVRAGRFASRHRVAVILLLTYVVVRALVLIFLGR